ncbi:MAG: sigma-54-dependent Fis family transcriptional regulator [Planctomycetaceae bacterium]|jgi:two-component system, NtrC family, response regulator HydG|nr:sigma-54-dependent Fis family transcriptional regulator [Planctomycetaceae bacterium]
MSTHSIVNSSSGSIDGIARSVRVLVVDNDIVHARTMGEGLERLGYKVTVAGGGNEGAEQLDADSFDVVVTDLMMNDIGGLEILKLAKQSSVETEVIVVTGHGTVPSAVEAMQQGAFTYLQKPLELTQLREAVEKASAGVRLRLQNLELNRRLDERFGFEGVVGSSTQMRAVIERLKRIAPTDATVLIQGATGTGKELVAQAIHQNSPRKKKPFVALNCAALSENILESELFGHIKGAFTDASSDRVGKFEYADGGTLFLDEVGDMPMATQIKLLRVLESGEITRVGSNQPVRVNVRILSATNRNLEDAVEGGTFRSDLYHRLKVVTIAIPSLQERSADIPLLIEHFMKQLSRRHQKTIKSMTRDARLKLLAFPWPGNVRQLRNVIESMIVVDCDESLDVDDLPLELEPYSGQVAGISTEGDEESNGIASLVGRPLHEIEKIFIGETLKLAAGNREQTAEMLGIGERTLYRKIKEYKLH